MNKMEKKIALLIDAENISHNYIDIILDEVANIGTPIIKRVYGDFTQDSVKPWIDKIPKYGLSAELQLHCANGKNSSDIALIIDAMDMLYRNDVDGFCIASSDSDYTSLVLKLKERGKLVIGMGNSNTVESLKNACNKFVMLDWLNKRKNSAITDKELKASEVMSWEELKKEIRNIIENNLDSDVDGWIHVGALGSYLKTRYPSFDVRYYKHNQLGKMLSKIPFIEIKEEVVSGSGEGCKILYARIKEGR